MMMMAKVMNQMGRRLFLKRQRWWKKRKVIGVTVRRVGREDGIGSEGVVRVGDLGIGL
jgi:hypothetical protein